MDGRRQVVGDFNGDDSDAVMREVNGSYGIYQAHSRGLFDKLITATMVRSNTYGTGNQFYCSLVSRLKISSKLLAY